MKLLVNNYEKVTYDKLTRVCQEEGARVCPKVRVKDALPIERTGISNEQYSYALTSHFDFVVTDGDSNTLFAVEFDGASHRSADAHRRDSLKNDLCLRFGLPLLRVNANYLKAQYRQWDLLTYFAETWFLARAFERGQAAGDIPADEDFDPMLIFMDQKGRRFPYWFSAHAQIGIQNLYRARRITQGVPSHYAGYDAQDNLHYFAWIEIKEDVLVSVSTAMRCQHFALCLTDVLSQIAAVELHKQLDEVLAGNAPSQKRQEIENKRKTWEDRLRMSSAASHCTLSLKG